MQPNATYPWLGYLANLLTSMYNYSYQTQINSSKAQHFPIQQPTGSGSKKVTSYRISWIHPGVSQTEKITWKAFSWKNKGSLWKNSLGIKNRCLNAEVRILMKKYDFTLTKETKWMGLSNKDSWNFENLDLLDPDLSKPNQEYSSCGSGAVSTKKNKKLHFILNNFLKTYPIKTKVFKTITVEL